MKVKQDSPLYLTEQCQEFNLAVKEENSLFQ